MSLANAFADALLRLHARLDGDPAVAGPLSAAAIALWQANAEGHACLVIDDADSRRWLAASPVVASPGVANRAEASPGEDEPAPPGLPLVIDGAALYLQRLWQAEVRLAQALDALDAPAPLASREAIEAMLDEVAPPADADPLQRDAIAAALTRRLAIVTGGPGTGKTTTMARLLVAVGRLAPAARIAIAAPTGKAAARLAQALSAQLAKLDPGGELARSLPAAGMTVHRLLGLRGDDAPAATAVPAYDLVIVDEASMLDLELACALATSVPESGRLVLAGDRDQLASVDAGAVFAEACASRLDGVVRLERNYRQADSPALTALARWLRDRCGALQGVDGCDKGAAGAVPFDPAAGVERIAPAEPDAIAAQALDAWEPALAAIDAGGLAQAIVPAFDAHRVLCAMRDGPLGVTGLNAAIAARVRRRVGARAGALWYTGRIVIVTRNRPELGLFNGDVGVCLPDPASRDSLAVAFDAGGEIRWAPVRQMPAHEDGFAITVHKSQGSEFESVALVPAPRGHRLNTRELLYTGATRARWRLAIWADAGTLDEGALRRTARHGRLADRIGALRAPAASRGR